jgi:hypothetical protein
VESVSGTGDAMVPAMRAAESREKSMLNKARLKNDSLNYSDLVRTSEFQSRKVKVVVDVFAVPIFTNGITFGLFIYHCYP